MPLRRRPARVPQHRRARPRRRPVGRGPVRRGGRARRPRHLRLPGRPGLAVLLPVHARPQHGAAGRDEPVPRGRPVPVAAARGHPGDRGSRRRRHGLLGRRARRLPGPGPRRPGTTARCGWTGPAAGWRSPTRSPAATRWRWPSTSALTSRPNSTAPPLRCAGRPRRRGLRPAGTARRPGVEPAPRVHRAHPRLVRAGPGAPGPGRHADRPRRGRARHRFSGRS